MIDRLRALLGIRSPPEPRLPSRLDAEAVLRIADDALEGSVLPLVVQDLAMRDGRLIWDVRTASIGSWWIVLVDDADGSVIDVSRVGIR